MTRQAKPTRLELVPTERRPDDIRPGHSPLYTQIKEILRGRILEGTYQPNQQMPSESEMMAAFGVSRITVRQALSDLQGEGLVFKVHGKGTYVSRPRVFQDLDRLQGFDAAMRQKGHETHSKVLSLKAVKPSPLVQERLGLGADDEITQLRRLRFLNREPISIDVSYLPLAVGERLARHDLAARDVFAILENDLQIRLGHADLQIRAMLADDEMGRQLGTETGSPILFIERTVHTTDGKPFEYENLYYRGDAFQYKVRVSGAPVDPSR
ncbi:MAG: GntR family transcriptional regulator [Burkholderiaceae bacterium]